MLVWTTWPCYIAKSSPRHHLGYGVQALGKGQQECQNPYAPNDHLGSSCREPRFQGINNGHISVKKKAKTSVRTLQRCVYIQNQSKLRIKEKKNKSRDICLPAVLISLYSVWFSSNEGRKEKVHWILFCSRGMPS